MTGTRLLIAAPIPSPDEWIVGAELPPGYMVLRSIMLSPRTPAGALLPLQRDGAAANRHGSDLVAAKDIEALPSQLERLLQAYALCDAAGRAELLKIAEVLADAT